MGRWIATALIMLLAACTVSGGRGVNGDGGGSGSPDGGSPGDDGSTGDSTTADDGQGSKASCTGGGSLAAVWPLGPALAPSSVATDGQGNVYVTGSFKGTATIGGTTLVASGPVDMFLVKLGPTGNVLSATHFGAAGAYADPVPVLAVDSAGDVVLAGFFSNTLDFGGSTKPLTAISVDAFVVRFAASGQAVWSERFGYDQGPYGIISIALAPGGDPVVAGTAGGTIVIGNTTWPAPDPAGSGNSQAFVARLSAADGSVVWSAASGGDVDIDKVQVAVDNMGRTFLAGRAQYGSSAWGTTPSDAPDAGYYFTQYRVGFDTTGIPMWSQFDEGAFPVSVAVDEEGRVAIVDTVTYKLAAGGATFTGVESVVALLFDPNDGSLLSGAVVPDAFPWAGAAGLHDFTVITGQYAYGPATFGNTVLPSPGPGPENERLYIAQLDPTSHFVWAAGIGAGNTQPLAMTVGVDGRAFVAGNTDTAFTTSAGSVPVGNFVAVFTPAVCADDPGPPVPAGDGSRGDLQDAAAPEPDASPAPCPSTQAGATNGATCPVPMGCSYGTTCCFCTPMPCNGQPTTWTCDPLGTPNPSCPATPPSAGASCPSGVQCNYCLSGGRYFANCTAGGWDVGYAQLLCQ